MVPPPPAGVFAANPLSLSVPETAFESWLRDTGYLEILDDRTSSPPSSSAAANRSRPHTASYNTTHSVSKATTTSSSKGVLGRVGNSGRALISAVRTLLSILSINPFGKLTAEDFAGSTPPWTFAFLTSGGGGEMSSYSWPAGPSQARMRVQENVKRYARNYAALCLLFFACTLYKMPIALFGLVSSLALWEALRLCSSWWDIEDRYPSVRFVLVRIAQLATTVILYLCNMHVAVLCAITVSYAVMILHASLRKLTSSKQSVGMNQNKRSHQNK